MTLPSLSPSSSVHTHCSSVTHRSSCFVGIPSTMLHPAGRLVVLTSRKIRKGIPQPVPALEDFGQIPWRGRSSLYWRPEHWWGRNEGPSSPLKHLAGILGEPKHRGQWLQECVAAAGSAGCFSSCLWQSFWYSRKGFSRFLGSVLLPVIGFA